MSYMISFISVDYFRGCLVRTGKYRPGDEAKETAEGKKPDFVFDSFAHCVERVLSDMKV